MVIKTKFDKIFLLVIVFIDTSRYFKYIYIFLQPINLNQIQVCSKNCQKHPIITIENQLILLQDLI